MNIEFIYILDIKVKLSAVKISPIDTSSIDNIIFSVSSLTSFNNVIYIIITKVLYIKGIKNDIVVVV